MEPRVLAEQDYLTGMKYKDIAEKYGVTINTVKSWKTRYKWNRVPTEKGVHTKRPGAKQVRAPRQAIERADITDKQRLFIGYYLKYWNATKAYQKAYACAYSTAMVEGHRLLRNPKVAEEIRRVRDELFADSYLTVQAIVQKYMDIAFADISDFVDFGSRELLARDANGNPMTVRESFVDVKSSSEIDGTILSEVKMSDSGVSVKLADRMRAMERLERYFVYLSEEDKLRLAKLRAEVKALEGPGETKTDDGFIDALKSKSAEIWSDEPAENDETDGVENESEDE